MRSTFIFALLAGAAAVDVTPIAKVINLIDGLAKEVEADGKTEATAYDKFACFCRDSTKKKSDSVKTGTKKIGVLSADIGDKTQEQTDDATELAKRKQDHENLNKKLSDEKALHAKGKAAYELEAADLSKAIQGLKDALKSMGDSKPSLLQVQKGALGESLRNAIDMAEAMGLLVAPKHKATASLFQQKAGVDPSDPEYKFHSQDIIDLCDQLLTDYKGSKQSLDAEWDKTDKTSKAMVKSLNKKLGANKAAMTQLSKNIQKLKKEIAQHREDLITANTLLQDDELYLKDLQARCEDRANDYDQRSAMRGDELGALNGALKVLRGDVQGRADTVNQRALLQTAPKVAAAAKVVAAPKAVAAAPKAAAPVAAAKSTEKTISLLQEFSASLRGRTSLTQEDRKAKALDVLRSVQGSVALTSLAVQAAADPFKKVKGLIQKLIERLLAESQAEATKKGFCDTELGKARKDRDYRYQEAQDLSADLSGLQAKKDALTVEIKQLKSDIKAESKALTESTDERKDEKEANAKTMKTAKEGLDALNNALLILRSFYKQAAKAAFVQASPVTEAGPGFDGNYKGKQDGANAIFALLETIQSDFERTLSKTEAAEASAHREYVAFSQSSQASIAGKETKQDLDEQDLKTTNTGIETKTDDMQTAVDLLDSALLVLKKLSPTCIDTGMSYSMRVKKREEEMDALRKALCMLDEEKVESECQGGLN